MKKMHENNVVGNLCMYVRTFAGRVFSYDNA